MLPDFAHIYAMAANRDELLDPPDPEKFATDRATVKGAFWSKVRKTVGRVPFLGDAIAAYFCATDSTTPMAVKALLFGALAYFIVPADMIPDFIAGLGFVDDTAILSAAVAMARRSIRPEHRDRAKTLLDETLRAAPDD